MPVGEAEPADRLREIPRRPPRTSRRSEQALERRLPVELSEFAAPTLIGLAARVVHRQPFVNLVVTNVPGPQVPLYCMGARLLEAYPIVPLTAEHHDRRRDPVLLRQLHFGL